MDSDLNIKDISTPEPPVWGFVVASNMAMAMISASVPEQGTTVVDPRITLRTRWGQDINISECVDFIEVLRKAESICRSIVDAASLAPKFLSHGRRVYLRGSSLQYKIVGFQDFANKLVNVVLSDTDPLTTVSIYGVIPIIEAVDI